MKRSIHVLALTLILPVVISAQIKPDLKRLDSHSRISQKTINTGLFKAKELRNDQESVNYALYSNIDFDSKHFEGFRVDRRSATGEISWLSGYIDMPKSLDLDNKVNIWLERAMEVMDLNKNDQSFEIINVSHDRLNESHIKLAQIYQGIKVYGAEIILHTEKQIIRSQNGTYLSGKRLPSKIEPNITEDNAKTIVLSDLDNYHEDWNKLKGLNIDFDLKRWRSELVLYPWDGSYLPAYHITVYPNLGEHFEYFVSAADGQVLRHYSTICTAHNHDHTHNPPDGPRTAVAEDLFGINRNLNTYEVGSNFFLIDGSRTMFSNATSVLPDDPVGAIWTIDLNNTSPINSNAVYTHIATSNNVWSSSPEGVSAHYNAGKAYEYFKQTFNRESISGTGQNIISFVNVADEDGSSLGNAFWNGLGIYYGNGDSAFNPLGRGLDVAGHEMSHGVVQATANLEYYGEPGAMNESFADVFGSMIDRDDWLIGEDVVKPNVFPSGALRSMSDPHNGAQTGDFGRGWQPKHVNEKFNGPEDNNGVHINSGIPNHAFYLFATQIGKDKAEQVFYRALTTYLTRSSGFKELRFAVVKSAEDLYGAAEVAAARQAFDQVGIVDEDQGDFQEEVGLNPGQDLLLVSDQAKSNLIVFDLGSGQPIFDPLTDIDQLSKPSITDDGSRIVFVGTDNHIYLIDIDWNDQPPTFSINQASFEPDWRNAVISKDGNRVALLDNTFNNEIVVIDLPSNSENTFTLTNPTYSNGVETGDVLFADAMEFDISGDVLMYDAINEVQSNNAGTLEFWDIAFLEVWNRAADTWALGRIDKLFGALPEGLSIGNPAFSKNSPFIIAMDFLDGQEFSILGVNIETGDVGELFPNTTVGYPNYSRDDNFLVYDLDFLGIIDVGILQVNSDKITRVNNSDDILAPQLRWGVWFSNGERQLSTSTEELVLNSTLKIYPNPVEDNIHITLTSSELEGNLLLEIYDTLGKRITARSISSQELIDYPIDVKQMPSGSYLLKISSVDKTATQRFIKN